LAGRRSYRKRKYARIQDWDALIEEELERIHRKEKNLSIEEAVWLAAAIDFEGSLIFCMASRRKKTPQWRDAFRPLLSIVNTNEALIDKVRDICGQGSVCWTHPRSKNGKAKPAKRFNLSSNGLRTILPQIQPYLIAKKRHAQLLIEALDLMRHNTGIGHNGQNDARLYEIKNEIHALNKRGL
jgi:hypothetical protein